MSPLKADVLSDLLRSVRLTGAVYFDFHLNAPWVAEAPASCEVAPVVMPGAQRVIEYHLIAHGHAWGHAVGGEPIFLQEGDLLIFPQGHPHVLSSAPGMRAEPDMSIYARASTPLPIVYEIGKGAAERTRLICGFLGYDERPFNPLIAALPATIHLPARDMPPGGGWLRTLLDVAAGQAGELTAGTENVLARLAELMFVEAIRRYLATLPDSEKGWLAGLRDDVVGRALSAMHGAPSDAWTVEHLARTIGVSRSVLAERFTVLIGQPPMQYLTLWRMQLASRYLGEGRQVNEVAGLVGYESEAAFSRAFRKLVGTSPVTWRRSAVAERTT
ncbi:MAG: AraC family transcriptional regulator [Vicinamibacterales bacterium]